MNPKRDLTIYYLAAVVALVLIGVGSLTAMKICRTEVDQTFIGLILGIITPTLVSLLALIRGEANGGGIARVAEKVDVNTNITQATHETVARVADSAIAPPRMPTRNLSGEFDR